MRTKGVKSNIEKLGNGVECTGSASQSELWLMRSLMGVRTEEALFTFSGVDWEAPFQRLVFMVIVGLLAEWAAFSGSGEEDQMVKSSA